MGRAVKWSLVVLCAAVVLALLSVPAQAQQEKRGEDATRGNEQAAQCEAG